MSTYPSTAERLLIQCERYRNDEVDLETLKNEVWLAACQLSIPEDRLLREFLQRAEGLLDMAQFTIDGLQLRKACIELVEGIEDRLHEYLN